MRRTPTGELEGEPSFQRCGIAEHGDDPCMEAIEHDQLPLACELGPALAEVRSRCSLLFVKRVGFGWSIAPFTNMGLKERAMANVGRMSSRPGGHLERLKRLRALVLCTALGLTAKQTRADEALGEAAAMPSIPVRVAFSSLGTKCNDPAEFLRLLRRHRSDVRQAGSSEAAILLEVRLDEQAGVTKGQVRLTSWDAVPALLQSVENAECNDVLSALALKAAMDPGLCPAPARPGPAPSAPPPKPETLSESRQATVVDAGQRLAVISPLAASRMWGVGLHVTVVKTGAFWAPAARLAAYVAQSGLIGEGLDFAKLDWFDARLAACPLLFDLGHSIEVRPCAALEAGRLSVTGKALPLTSTTHTLWLAGGAELALSWLASRTFSLGIEAATTFPFERPDFYFRRAGEEPFAYRTPAAVLMVAAGVGWRFQQ